MANSPDITEKRRDHKAAVGDLWRRLVTASPPRLVIGALAVLVVLAFGLLPLPTALLVLMAPLAVCLILVDPVVSLYLAILSVPAQEVILLPGGVSLTQAAMALAVFHATLSYLANPERSLRLGRLFPFWMLFLWALLLSTALTTYSPIEGLKETTRWFEAFVIWLLAVNLVRHRWQAIGLVACLLLAPLSEAVIGLIQFALGAGPPSFRIAAGLPFVRAYGTIGQPNSFAGYLNMGWPLALALAVGLTWRRLPFATTTPFDQQQSPSSYLRSSIASWLMVLGAWLLVVVLMAGLLVSFSRGAWLGALCGLLGMALALGGRARWFALAAIGLGALALALGGAGLLPAFAANRLDSIVRYLSFFDAGAVAVTPDNFAIVERMSQMQAGWRMLLAHPLTGVGPGNYSVAYPMFAIGQWYVSRGHAHNYYLHMAAETGIVGAIAYAALLVAVIRQLLTTLRHSSGMVLRGAAIGCCGIIAAVMGHDLFENLHALSMGIQLASVWGLLTIIEYWQKRPQNQTKS